MTFRREPTVYIQALAALLAFVVTFGLDWLTAEQAGLIVALVAAGLSAWNAWKVRPVAPAIFQGVVTTGAALLTTYGLDFSQERIGTFQLLLVAVLTLLTRTQVTPREVLHPTSPTQGVVA